ncbi:MAG: AMP-binding protein [Anaerolineae bacterium]|nr:AMP-binding protein [Anaerolineae bacterium]
MNIASLLMSVPELDRPALVFSTPNKTTYTFKQVNEASSRLADGFRKNKLCEGSRVIVLAPISLNLYISLIAMFKLGVIPVFLDPQTRTQELRQTIESAQPQALICSQRLNWLRWFLPGLRKISLVFLSDGNSQRSVNHLINSSLPYSKIADLAAEAPALITFTGGSTDALGSRGVIRTHGLLTAQHVALSHALPNHFTDIDLPAFPIATLHNLASGITSVIPDFPFRRPDAVQPEKILKQVNDHGISTASGSPAYWSAIAEHCLRHKLTLPLRRIVTGGAPVSPALMDRLQRAAPSAEIVNVYGSTEAEPVAVIKANEILAVTKKPEALGAGIPLGRAVPESRIRILDENGTDLESGKVGEIWVSGEHVARSYFANPAADLQHKRFDAQGDLWHGMGDLGYVDGEGLLWLAGRVNMVVLRDGQAMYPVKIEMLAASLSFVRRAALIGQPDVRLGERSVLIVEFAASVITPKDWQAQLQALCIQYGWTLDEIRWVRRLPVDVRHNSRLDYKRLKAKSF